MADRRHARGVIDTSVVIDLEVVDVERLPRELAVSAMTMAELAAGPHATTDEPLPVDADVARAYGRVYAVVVAAGRKARGRRAIDLFIAATAVAADLPLYTRNPADFAGLSPLLEIVAV